MGNGEHGTGGGNRLGRAADVAAVLRAYVLQRPGAADTFRGVSEWWLAGLEPPATLADTLAALELLEREGLLERIRVDDGAELWRRARPSKAGGG